MAYPSPYGDVEVVHLKPALRKHGIEYTEADDHLLIRHRGTSAVIDIEGRMASGLSVEHACYRIEIDPLDVYNDIIRIEERAERRR